MTKWIWIAGGVIISAAFLTWLFIESSKPLPGEKQTLNCDNFTDFSKLRDIDTSDKCRAHVPSGTEVNYPTNPPTMGPHYADWIRVGVYSEEKDDRNLIHSLEHGYVVMSYKCSSPVMLEGVERSIASSEKDSLATPSASLQNDNGVGAQETCDQRKSQLEEIYNKKGKKKLIVVPKGNLDTNFALTAWQYIDKFDQFDGIRIEKFIDAHLNNGPEKTME